MAGWADRIRARNERSKEYYSRPHPLGARAVRLAVLRRLAADGEAEADCAAAGAGARATGAGRGAAGGSPARNTGANDAPAGAARVTRGGARTFTAAGHRDAEPARDDRAQR